MLFRVAAHGDWDYINSSYRIVDLPMAGYIDKPRQSPDTALSSSSTRLSTRLPPSERNYQRLAVVRPILN
jgi:hypothetical protein